MAKNPSPYVSTSVPFKPSPVRPVTAIKPVKPFVWKAPALPKPPKPDRAAPQRMVKISVGGPAIVQAQTAAKR